MSIAYMQLPERPLEPIGDSPFHQWVFPDGTLWTQFFRRDSGYLLRFPDLADFDVSVDGSVVKGWPAPDVSGPTVEHLYLNQVMPLALSRQGKLVLHGSAVDFGGKGVAFLGASGRGKSTLAASFASKGSRFLTDDGLHLESVSGKFVIVPGHPSIRLWEDSQNALVNSDVAAAPAVSFTSKVRFLAGPGIAFCEMARPLSCVFLLGEGDTLTPTIQRLRPSEALIELVRHSFLLDIEAQDMLARHFDELSRLAAFPIIFRLDYPRSYGDLPAVRETVIQHVLDLRL